MKVLVTGATGYIGGWTLAALTARGHDVVAVVRDLGVGPTLMGRTTERGGDGSRVRPVHGDLTRRGLGLDEVPDVDVVVHLGAAFGWGLDPRAARTTNVDGTLEVVSLAGLMEARLVLVGGYMLRNAANLGELGVDASAPEATDWPRVHRRAGAYEASKIEAYLRGRAEAESLGVAWTAVHPAVLLGQSTTGDLAPGQPFRELVGNVVSGRLRAAPGTDRHWLPLVSVDHVAALLSEIVEDPPPSGTDLLALDPATPDLVTLVGLVAGAAGRPAPKRRVPLPLVRRLATTPLLRHLVPTSRESLAFMRTERFDLTQERSFLRSRSLGHPDLAQAVAATVRTVVAEGAAGR